MQQRLEEGKYSYRGRSDKLFIYQKSAEVIVGMICCNGQIRNSIKGNKTDKKRRINRLC